MLRAGHAENALPQSATATVNCRIFPGVAVKDVGETLLRVGGNPALKLAVLDDPRASPESPLREDVMDAVAQGVANVGSSLFGGINEDLQVFAGRAIDQPSLFIAGRRDWGIHQRPGALDEMQTRGCTDLRGLHLLEGAGHWVQQERPEAVTTLLIDFLASV